MGVTSEPVDSEMWDYNSVNGYLSDDALRLLHELLDEAAPKYIAGLENKAKRTRAIAAYGELVAFLTEEAE